MTFDTNVFPAGPLVSRAGALGFDIAVISVTRREVEGATIAEEIEDIKAIVEFTVWGEFAWGQGKWARPEDGAVLEKALKILSNGSFPPQGRRNSLSAGETRQLRDALILATHVQEGRDILVSNDRRAFVNHGRRESIESEFKTRVRTVAEFEAHLGEHERRAL